MAFNEVNMESARKKIRTEFSWQLRHSVILLQQKSITDSRIRRWASIIPVCTRNGLPDYCDNKSWHNSSMKWEIIRHHLQEKCVFQKSQKYVYRPLLWNEVKKKIITDYNLLCLLGKNTQMVTCLPYLWPLQGRSRIVINTPHLVINSKALDVIRRDFLLNISQKFDRAHIPNATPRWVIISFI